MEPQKQGVLGNLLGNTLSNLLLRGRLQEIPNLSVSVATKEDPHSTDGAQTGEPAFKEATEKEAAASNKEEEDLVLKVSFENIQDSADVASSPACKFPLSALSELSYEVLIQKVISLALCLKGDRAPPASSGDYLVALRYKDSDGCWIHIASTDGCVEAVREFSGERFLHLFATVRPKKDPNPPPPRVPPSPAASSNSGAPHVAATTSTPFYPNASVPPAGVIPTVISSSVPIMPPDRDLERVVPAPPVVAATRPKKPAPSSCKRKHPPGARSPSHKRRATGSSASFAKKIAPKKEESNDSPTPLSERRKKTRVNYAALAIGLGEDLSDNQASSAASVAQERQGGNEDAMQQEPPAKTKRRGSDGDTIRDKICLGMGELRALGIEEPLRAYVARSAGYTNCASKSFANQLSALKKEGMVEYRKGDRMTLTARGLQYLPRQFEKPNSNAETQARLKLVLKLKGKNGNDATRVDQIFTLLGDGQAHEKEEVAQAMGYSNVCSKGFSNLISKMSGLGLLHRPRKGAMQLTDIAFPFGRGNTN